jgi:nucleoside-diphosphate-sugar epimerase
MRVFVTGATGTLGTEAVAALLNDGHEVTGLARSDDKARSLESMGAAPARVDFFDITAMTAALRGHEAVCNLVTAIPVGLTALRPGAWKANDFLRTTGSKMVAAAAKSAGVRRLVQESISFMYADGGDSWITETSPVCVTHAVEPAVMAETAATEFGSTSHQHVILRFGSFVGNDRITSWRLAQARAGRPVGLGDPQGWAHVVHPHDAGAAVAVALAAPGGVYNVGAEPVLRSDLAEVLAAAAGRSEARFFPRWALRAASNRLEPLTRSHRVSSTKLHEATGWKPEYDVFDSSWVPQLVCPMSGAPLDGPADDVPRPLTPDIFGDVLPDITRDEGRSTEREAPEDSDEDLLRNVPPHHG